MRKTRRLLLKQAASLETSSWCILLKVNRFFVFYFTVLPGKRFVPGGIILPGYIVVLIPVCTPLPTIAPNLRRFVETKPSLVMHLWSLPSWRRLAMTVPAPLWRRRQSGVWRIHLFCRNSFLPGTSCFALSRCHRQRLRSGTPATGIWAIWNNKRDSILMTHLENAVNPVKTA